MKTKLGAFEILTMAETIERDSIDFYRKAARRFDDEELRKKFFLLADWERKHQEIFSAMKKELTQILDERTTFDASSFVLSNPQALRSLASSAAGSESSRELTGKESREEILELAISRERNTIGFYYDLTGAMGESIGKSKINDIIKEEQRHIGILRRALEPLSDAQSSARSS